MVEGQFQAGQTPELGQLASIVKNLQVLTQSFARTDKENPGLRSPFTSGVHTSYRRYDRQPEQKSNSVRHIDGVLHGILRGTAMEMGAALHIARLPRKVKKAIDDLDNINRRYEKEMQRLIEEHRAAETLPKKRDQYPNLMSENVAEAFQTEAMAAIEILERETSPMKLATLPLKTPEGQYRLPNDFVLDTNGASNLALVLLCLNRSASVSQDRTRLPKATASFYMQHASTGKGVTQRMGITATLYPAVEQVANSYIAEQFPIALRAIQKQAHAMQLMALCACLYGGDMETQARKSIIPLLDIAGLCRYPETLQTPQEVAILLDAITANKTYYKIILSPD